MNLIQKTVTAVVALAASCVSSHGAWAKNFVLTSPDIKDGGAVNIEQVFDSLGCKGGNISPELQWHGAPAGTKSFALTVYDPDAPTGSGFWHWVVYDIPSDATGLKKGAGSSDGHLLPAGAQQNRTDYGINAYGGPCPPEGDKPHRYRFTLFAVDVPKLSIPEGATAAVVGFNLHFHTLAKTVLTAKYGR